MNYFLNFILDSSLLAYEIQRTFVYWFCVFQSCWTFLVLAVCFGFLGIFYTHDHVIWIEIVLLLSFQSEGTYLFFLLNCSGKKFPVQCCIQVMGILTVHYFGGETFSLLPLNMMRVVGFYWCPSSVPSLLSVFTITACWTLLNAFFFLSMAMIVWVLAFVRLLWCSTVINFHILSQTCILGINPFGCDVLFL